MAPTLSAQTNAASMRAAAGRPSQNARPLRDPVVKPGASVSASVARPAAT